MDPVSLFNALYDSKCLKFGRYELKSGLVAPYYMNLRRLPLYPLLMDAVVTRVVERYLSPEEIDTTISHIKRKKNAASCSAASRPEQGGTKASLISMNADSDSHLGKNGPSSDDDEWENVATDCMHHDPVICGVPYGAIPLASAIAHRAKLPFLFDRKEPKAHGDHQSLLDDFTKETRGVVRTESGLPSDVVNRKQQVVLIEDVICSGESILETVRRLERQNIRVEFVICIIDREENGINLLERVGIHVVAVYKISAILRVLEATGRISNGQFISVLDWIARNQFKHIGIDPTISSSITSGVSIPETHKTVGFTIEASSA